MKGKRILVWLLTLMLVVAMAPGTVFAAGKADAPAAPDAVKAVAKSKTSIKVSWSSVEDADGYAVYQKMGGKYKKVKTLTKKSYVSKKLKSTKKYSYKIKAYKVKKGKKVFGKFSDVVTAVPKNKKVANVKKITINADSAVVEKGMERKLSVKLSPSKKLVSSKITWSSSDKTVATVSKGKVKGVAEGSCTITARAHNGITAQWDVTVIDLSVPADQVFKNGYIYTEDADKNVAGAVAIRDGKFIFVGDSDEPALDKLIGEKTEVNDLEGAMVIPGMFDAHSHPGMVALDWAVNMPWTYDLDELLTFVKEYCEAHPVEEVPYFYGRYYPSDIEDVNGFQLNAKMIDEYVSDRPVRLQDFSDHSCWFNSKALEMMGIDKNTPDPEGTSQIVRDEEGNPTGVFHEFAGFDEQKIYDAIGWEPPVDIDGSMWEYVISNYHAAGIIGMGDAIIENEESMKAIYEMDQAGKLDMYYSAMVLLYGYDYVDDAIATAKYYQENYSTDNITIDTIKFFYDGTNEIGTSCVVEPFSNDPTGHNHGEVACSTEELTEIMVRLNEAGLDLQLHVVGDGGLRNICDATEAAQKQLGDDFTMQIEACHLELIHAEDATRPAELGIIVNWTPHWTGGYFGDAAIEWLGQERFDSMYNFQPMIEAGAVVNFGSDTVSRYEFHRSSPFFGMETAITRVDPEYPMDETKYPGAMRPLESSKFTMEQMIEGYSINGAKQFRIDDIAGSIEAGKDANLCVVKENLFNVDPFALSEIEPTLVMFKGEKLDLSAEW